MRNEEEPVLSKLFRLTKFTQELRDIDAHLDGYRK